MNFERFAEIHGLIIRQLTMDRWVRVPTVDHPHKNNGSYKYVGDVGWVQNWATMDKPSMWKADDRNPLQPHILRQKSSADRDRQELAEKAASKAGWIMHQTTLQPHEYLKDKGFPDETGNVWEKDGKSILVIPMRRDGKLVGCQLIDDQGNKKFLYGQQTKGASFTMDAKGTPIFCEGFATGLSIQAIMRANKIRYCIHVCFSAGNMKEIARNISGGIVIADNDPNGVGERFAQETGKPYWISDTVGEDFNDYHQRVGLFKASQTLKKILPVALK